jgi:hypothetical protein
MKFIRLYITIRATDYLKFARFIKNEYKPVEITVHNPYIDITVATDKANSIIHCGLAYNLLLRQEVMI